MARRKQPAAQPAADPTPDDTRDEPGTAFARIQAPAEAPRPSEAKKVPEAEAVQVPAALLLAADGISARNDSERPYLMGVFLHALDGVGRVAATDGIRLFVGSFAIPGAVPGWMDEGIILSNDGLRPRVSMLAKATGTVGVSHAVGMPRVELYDAGRSIVFQVATAHGDFPDYQKVIPAAAFGSYDLEGETRSREWEPVGINSTYLKQIGDVAKTLDAGLLKENRSPKGMVVRAYNSGNDPSVPMVFDFSTYPGAILVMMTQKLASPAVSPETAAILAPAAKSTIAALRAHGTRWLMKAEATKNKAEAEEYRAKAAGFADRVAEIIKRLPGQAALIAAPAAQPDLATPVQEPELPDEAGEEGNAQAEGWEAEALRQSRLQDGQVIDLQQVKARIAEIEADEGRALSDEEKAVVASDFVIHGPEAMAAE